jgi:hypothetical protein
MKIPGAVGAACLQCALSLLLLPGVKGGGPCFHVGDQPFGCVAIAMGHFNSSLLKGEMHLPWECTSFIE